MTEGILKICLREGKKNNIQKIKKINIVVGELTGLIPSCISYYFNIVAKGTLAENAEIKVITQNIEVKCNECNYKGQVEKHQYVCPKCFSDDIKIIKGKELFVDTIEVE